MIYNVEHGECLRPGDPGLVTIVIKVRVIDANRSHAIPAAMIAGISIPNNPSANRIPMMINTVFIFLIRPSGVIILHHVAERGISVK